MLLHLATSYDRLTCMYARQQDDRCLCLLLSLIKLLLNSSLSSSDVRSFYLILVFVCFSTMFVSRHCSSAAIFMGRVNRPIYRVERDKLDTCAQKRNDQQTNERTKE